MCLPHHVSQSHSFPFPFMFTFYPFTPAHIIKFKKNKDKKDKRKNVIMEVVVRHSESPIYPLSLLASAHFKESLILFRASGFYYTFDVEPSLGLLLNVLLLSIVQDILQFWVCRTSCFMYSEDHRWGRCWSGPIYNSGFWPG